MDLLVPASMTLLAVAAAVADHSGVVSSQIPRAVAVETLALADDDHSMAGNHCHCPVQVDFLANGRLRLDEPQVWLPDRASC